MDITVSIELNPEEKQELAGILNVAQAQLGTKIKPYAEAAIKEYVQMFLGKRVMTRGSDIREHRLFLLIQSAFGNAIPNERVVSSLFQCTPSQSRSLIRSVLSKYQYQLREATKTTVVKVLRSIKKDDDSLVILIDNEAIASDLNGVLQSLDGTLDQIVKRAGKLAEYEIKKSAYLKLCTSYGEPPRDLS
jgi:hypothetical protein